MAINPNKQGSGYINIRNYLQANPNINLGQKINTTFGKEVGSLDKSFQGAKDQFSQDLSKTNVNTAENQATRDAALANPENVVNDPSKLTQFQSFLNPNFSAPNTTNLETLYGTTQSMAQDVTNPAYKTNLLQRYYGQQPKTSYSTGQKTLDTVFLNTPQSSQSLGESRKTALQKLGQQRSALAGAQGQIGVAKGQTEQFGKDTQSKLNTNIGDYVDETRGSLTNRLKNYNDTKGTFNTEIDNSFKTGEFSQEMADKLGIREGQNLYGLKGDQFYDTNNYTLSNVATDADRARLGALSQLKGEASPLDTTQGVLTDQSKYGAFDKNKVASYMTDQQKNLQEKTSAAGLNLEETPGYFAEIQKEFSPLSGYQYDEQLKPFLMKSMDIRSVGDAQKYTQELGSVLAKARQSWQQELATSNPTERKRANMDQYFKTYQNQLNKINNIAMNKSNEVSNQLYGNQRVKVKKGA